VVAARDAGNFQQGEEIQVDALADVTGELLRARASGEMVGRGSCRRRRVRLMSNSGVRAAAMARVGETQPPTQPPEHIFVRLQIGAAAEPFSLKDE